MRISRESRIKRDATKKWAAPRPIGEPLDRVPHAPTVHRTVGAPLLILLNKKVFRVLRDAPKGSAFGIRRLLKKADENFPLALRGRLLICKVRTNYESRIKGGKEKMGRGAAQKKNPRVQGKILPLGLAVFSCLWYNQSIKLPR